MFAGVSSNFQLTCNVKVAGRFPKRLETELVHLLPSFPARGSFVTSTKATNSGTPGLF